MLDCGEVCSRVLRILQPKAIKAIVSDAHKYLWDQYILNADSTHVSLWSVEWGGRVVIWGPGLGLMVPIWGDCVLSCVSIRFTEMFQGNCKPRGCFLVKSQEVGVACWDLFQMSFDGLQGDSEARHRIMSSTTPTLSLIHKSSSCFLCHGWAIHWNSLWDGFCLLIWSHATLHNSRRQR